MILIVVIAFISLIGLLIIHEFGHFIMAKKFGVKVEEFGVFLPPRLLGKKIGETIYSVNLLPFGAFVRIYGQEEKKEEPWSFTTKPFWQKSLILLAGVVSFWLVSIILLTIVMAIGAPVQIGDDENSGLLNPKVQLYAIAKNSPAEQAGLKVGDAILNVKDSQGREKAITKIGEFQEIIESNKGKEIVFTIERIKERFQVQITPRVSPPAGEGAVGVVLARTALKAYPWYLAPVKGVQATWNLTLAVLDGWGTAISRLVKREPTGAQLMGPVGIFGLFTQVGQLGPAYFMQMVAVISVYVALFNLVPIPVTDGGQFLFLAIGRIRKKELNQEIVQKVNAFFYILLLVLLLWVTIKDVGRLF